ncbi:MAG: radical SAM protein [Candidatus Gastranaerophilales bacterium]|nr:radical SAM protein [Candidatus Gastranaerophilales bacterium]
MKINYSKLFDIARDLYSLISYKSNSGKAIIPLRYSLELTYRCNLSCPYCYVGQDRNKQELTTQEWFDVINQIPFYGLVTLVGGEPMLRKDFKEILLKSLKQVHGKVNVVSNGILLNENILKTFVDKKMLLLSVSLDGHGKNHDINRDKEGIFEKITSNLEKLKELKGNKKYPMLDIKTIVLENNLDDLPKLYKYCEEMNADFMSIAFLRNNDLKQNSILRENLGEEFYQTTYPIKKYFDMENFEQVYKELESLSKKGKTKIRFAPKFNENNAFEEIEKFFETNEEKPIDEIYKPCLYPWANTIITPSGDMYPCLSYKIGNVKDKKLVKVWNDQKFRCFRKNLKTKKVFTSCQMCCELVPKFIPTPQIQTIIPH